MTPKYTVEEYNKAVELLEATYSAFHKVGAKAYHPGLETIQALDAAMGRASQAFRTIHVGGTNGKGSVASTIAAVLVAAGYKTGLYTSPHLLDFRERIRVDGEMISCDFVVDFMRRVEGVQLPAPPSYFEMMTAMAFAYFAECKVDVAVIEVGLGGRLDSTNIISPELCVITNISEDHTAILGNTPEAIAKEKAGIIKKHTPVVIGAADKSVRAVFNRIATANNSPIIFAQENPLCKAHNTGSELIYINTPWGNIKPELVGDCQVENAATILNALVSLSTSFDISPNAVRQGFANVSTLSGLLGRWMRLEINGLHYLCDTGHNPGAWQYLGSALTREAEKALLRVIIGFVEDKNIKAILPYMPRNAEYFFVEPNNDRARSASATSADFAEAGIKGMVCGAVRDAMMLAAKDMNPGGLIFVGGSTFVVAEFLSNKDVFMKNL